MRHVLLIGCGSFNPVTNMHLRMFELARDALLKTGHYCVIGGIASPVSDGYKKAGLLSANHRVEMLRLALRPGDGPASWVQLGAWEVGQDQWTPTVQVLRHYQSFIDAVLSEPEDQECHEGPPGGKKRKTDNLDDDLAWLAQLLKRVKAKADADSAPLDVRPMLLCGADVLQSFAMQGVWEDEDMTAIVRDFGMAVLSRPGCDPQKFVHTFDLINPYEGNIHLFTEWSASDISSTLVRRTLRRNESVRYLVPDGVIDYIYRNRLYGTTTGWPRLDQFAD